MYLLGNLEVQILARTSLFKADVPSTLPVSAAVFCICGLNSVNKLIVVTVRCCVLFEVRTEFLNII
jgi:hypothetical protein